MRLCRGVVGDAGDRAGRCWWRVRALSGSSGEIVVLSVAGEVDLCSIGVLRAALDRAWSSRPAYVLVDVAGLSFCSARGMAELVAAGRPVAGTATGYAVSGVSPVMQRCWSALWPAADLPVHFPSATAGLLSLGACPDDLDDSHPEPAKWDAG